MKIISTIQEMQALADRLRGDGKSIGFVPTMGFLHEGHLSLMRQARKENDTVVASIFVNPTQFGPHEDLDRYPRDAEGDQAKCESAGVDVLFLPSAAEMYPEKPSVFVSVEGVSEALEGAIRPGHFRGVATVVAKLFYIVKPHAAYFGQKDFQQCAVILRMAKGLNMDVQINILPIIREPDGLAMSSRNSYLSAGERHSAAILFKALSSAVMLYKSGERNPDLLEKAIRNVLRMEPGLTIDYVAISDPDTLAPLMQDAERIVILLAVRVGPTRLIDNILLP